MSIKTDFLSAIDTYGILAGKTPMGTLAKHYYYGEDGFKNWKIVSHLNEYNVSRESNLLLQCSTQELNNLIPDNSHLYLLGTSNEEALLFTLANQKFSSISCVDIVPHVAEQQRETLQNTFQKASVNATVLDYQATPLPDAHVENKVILYPSSNIGNSVGYYNQHVTENQMIVDQLELFRQKANMLIILYDSNSDPRTNTSAYTGALHAKFVLDSFISVAESVGIKGLEKDRLVHSPQWNQYCSAVLHQIIVAKEQRIIVENEVINLNKGQVLYPGHSYKFVANDNQNDMDVLAKKAGWIKHGSHIGNSDITVKMQVYRSESSPAVSEPV